MNATGKKKLLNLLFSVSVGLFLSLQLSAQCDSLRLEFSFSYLSGDTVLLLNRSEGFDQYEWAIEGGQVWQEFEQSLFLLAHTDSVRICLTGRHRDGCEKTVCQIIFPGHQDELCHQTDCIWPGDANGDGSANQYDLLNIGLGFGSRGPARTVFPVPEDPIFWAPSYNTDWAEAIGAVNYKHLDCDGNGVINEDDLLAIQRNYSPASSLSNRVMEGSTPVSLDLKSSIDYKPDSSTRVSIWAELKVGSIQLPVEDLHGLALRLRFPDQPFSVSSVQVAFEGSELLGAKDEVLSLSKKVSEGEKQDFLDLAFSKKNTAGSSGFGKAVSIRIISADIIELINSPATEFKVAIEGLLMIDSKGDTLPYDLPVDVACVNFIENISTSSRNEQLPAASLQIMPNPTSGSILLRTQPGIRLQQYSLMNMAGQVIALGQLGGLTQARIELNAQRPGWYFLKIQTDKGFMTKRVLKVQ
jgi:hypothetical protein